MSHPALTADPLDVPRGLADAAASLVPATPDLLLERLLHRRFDRKYVVPIGHVTDLVSSLAPTHAVLEAGQRRLARYVTLYFDSPDRKAYHDHRRGRPRRGKVRMRHYPDRHLTMLELKQRRGNGQTAKLRQQRAALTPWLTPDELEWTAAALPWARQLVPMVTSHFLRINLLGIDAVERVTIDVALGFSHHGRQRDAGSVAIVEVKTPRWQQRGPVSTFLHARGIRPRSFSKYCVGSILVEDSLPAGPFRPVLKHLDHLTAGAHDRA